MIKLRPGEGKIETNIQGLLKVISVTWKTVVTTQS